MRMPERLHKDFFVSYFLLEAAHAQDSCLERLAELAGRLLQTSLVASGSWASLAGKLSKSRTRANMIYELLDMVYEAR